MLNINVLINEYNARHANKIMYVRNPTALEMLKNVLDENRELTQSEIDYMGAHMQEFLPDGAVI